jgi:hypothetical protein
VGPLRSLPAGNDAGDDKDEEEEEEEEDKGDGVEEKAPARRSRPRGDTEAVATRSAAMRPHVLIHSGSVPDLRHPLLGADGVLQVLAVRMFREKMARRRATTQRGRERRQTPVAAIASASAAAATISGHARPIPQPISQPIPQLIPQPPPPVGPLRPLGCFSRRAASLNRSPPPPKPGAVETQPVSGITGPTAVAASPVQDHARVVRVPAAIVPVVAAVAAVAAVTTAAAATSCVLDPMSLVG